MKLASANHCARTLCPPPASDTDLPVWEASDGDAADRELARLAKAVAHPVRVRILRLLAEREACVCGELVEALPLAQSTVSQHLKVLKDAGLIRGEITSPQVCYCLEPAGLRRLRALLDSL